MNINEKPCQQLAVFETGRRLRAVHCRLDWTCVQLAHTDLFTRMSAKQHEAMQADSQSRQTLRDVPSPTLMHLLTLPARFDQASSQTIKQ